MNTFGRRWLVLALVAALSGCSGGGGDDEQVGTKKTAATTTPSTSTKGLVGPNLNGKWKGTFSVMGDGRDASTSLTATIRHTGSSIFIKTSLVGIGASLTGTINAAGDIYLTDAFDGETWTTHFGPATSTSVRIADFAEDPSTSKDPPIELIDLVRASAP